MKLLVGKNHLHLGENMFTLYENPHYLQNTSKITIAYRSVAPEISFQKKK